MNNSIEYRGYTGSVEFSQEDHVFFGKVLGVKALISYEGSSADELISDFQGAVDDYLSLCQERGIAPEKPYKGSFNVRISPELHRQAAVFADAHHISLNKTVENALLSYVARP